MSSPTPMAPAGAPKDVTLVKVRPTLFIALGGTGLEVALRLRRRILNGLWGRRDAPIRVASLAQFPVAEFIHFDLDQNAILERGRDQKDARGALVRFAQADRLVEKLDLNKYIRTDDQLSKYPHIRKWFPLPPKTLRDLNLDIENGAGQIRGVARLYLFDQYPLLLKSVLEKCRRLAAGLSSQDDLRRLGFDTDTQAGIRIVIIASTAGGTGSGSFLDMGLLAPWAAARHIKGVETHLFLFQPTGYATAGRRTEANGYAALMELEALMRHEARNFVDTWDGVQTYEGSEVESPFKEIYLLDTWNVAGQHTARIEDIYEMVADILFEDFAAADFATWKRSVGVNQRTQHKSSAYHPKPAEGYGDVKLVYHKGYSAIGQAILDTQQSVRRNIESYEQVALMLKSFFGVLHADPKVNRATDKERDAFLADALHLRPLMFSDLPEFSAKVELKRAQGEFWDYAISNELLATREGNLLPLIGQKVAAQLERIAAESSKDEWPAKVEEALRQLNRDAIKDVEGAAGTIDERVERARGELKGKAIAAMTDKLYAYLDNKEFGGIDFTLSLVELVKDRLENDATGIVRALRENAERYRELRDNLRAAELERLLGNLKETRGMDLIGSKRRQAETILGQVKQCIQDYLQFHARAAASAEAAKLLLELSAWLGERESTDEVGNALWSGFLGELQAGRRAVNEMLEEIDASIAHMRDDTKKDHATYIYLPDPSPAAEGSAIGSAQALAWAREALEGSGGFAGSREIFALLKTREGKQSLIAKLRARAESERPREQGGEADPLFAALDALRTRAPAQLERIFSDLLNRAMPWVGANLAGEFEVNSNQYMCIVGVSDKARYEERFGKMLRAQIPPLSRMTGDRIQFERSGAEGKLLCYVELSGIPLPCLNGLESWRAAYRIESAGIPLHTHADKTLFVHPALPDWKALAQDFKSFLQGVALGLLQRGGDGSYWFDIGEGDRDMIPIGSERLIRMDGLPHYYAPAIRSKITAALEAADPTQRAALAWLMDYYAVECYPRKIAIVNGAAQAPLTGFAHAMSRQLHDEAWQALQRQTSGGESALIAALERLKAAPGQWSEAIGDSERDVYASEVDTGKLKPKRKVKQQFFEPGWLDRLLSQSAEAAPVGQPGRSHPPPFGAAPPGRRYWLRHAEQEKGPFDFSAVAEWLRAGQLPPDTYAWSEGMAEWQLLTQVAEFAALAVKPAPFQAPPFQGKK